MVVKINAKHVKTIQRFTTIHFFTFMRFTISRLRQTCKLYLL